MEICYCYGPALFSFWNKDDVQDLSQLVIQGFLLLMYK